VGTRSIYLFLVYLAIFGLGMGAPFLLTLGYEWVDIFRPENVALRLIPKLPMSFLIGSATIATYFLFDRRSPPRFSAITVLTVAFALWVTLTCFWAEFPGSAWIKWDWAFKSILFSAFIPFVIRSRVQIEAFIQVYIFSVAAHFIAFGAKTFVTGGGYALHLGLIQRNFFLGEQDTLAAACGIALPLLLYLARHTQIIPRNRFTVLGYYGLVAFTIAAIIGSQERAAFLSLIACAGLQWWKSRRKFFFAVVIALVGVTIVVSAPATWQHRMSTIVTAGEHGMRSKVWAWTLGYVRDNPLGGGFNAYLINRLEAHVGGPDSDQTRILDKPVAFHSGFFEVLGEQGWPGLFLFLALIAASLWSLLQAARMSRDKPHLLWCYDLANALQISLIAGLTCTLFVGIAYQPFILYFFALALSVREYAWRVTRPLEAAPRPAQDFALARSPA
jgi:probable O-glycosylation ligase (exosortase A-associated)